MAKSKNHTAHNQTNKNHANGIKKPKRQRYLSTDGVDPKFLRNQRFAKKVTLKLQEAWMAYVAEQEAKPAFEAWKKKLADEQKKAGAQAKASAARHDVARALARTRAARARARWRALVRARRARTHTRSPPSRSRARPHSRRRPAHPRCAAGEEGAPEPGLRDGAAPEEQGRLQGVGDGVAEGEGGGRLRRSAASTGDGGLLLS
jgi:large subunit ribosomal protein L29e